MIVTVFRNILSSFDVRVTLAPDPFFIGCKVIYHELLPIPLLCIFRSFRPYNIEATKMNEQ